MRIARHGVYVPRYNIIANCFNSHAKVTKVMAVCECVAGWLADSTLPQIINSILHAQLQLDEEQIGISCEHEVKIFDVVRWRLGWSFSCG